MAKIAAASVATAEMDKVAIILLALVMNAKTASILIWIHRAIQVKSVLLKPEIILLFIWVCTLD